ncbi:hypothetical protein GF337_15905 [candidate division KSB1 bacterium]|nr:hypothetical protein [candidate division KSB1 bacterium]
MTKFFKIIIIFQILFSIFTCSEQKQDPVMLARVGSNAVTLSEFRERLSNILLHTTQDNAELRDALLQNLINEKVLIQEAVNRGYNQTDEFRHEKKRLELDFMLDKYRESVAENRIEIEESDIERAFALSREQVRARILYAPTEEQANLYYKQLMNGATFDELALGAFQDPRLSQTGGDMGYFSWQDMELPFSEAAQELELNQISKPVMTRNGWYIIKVEDRFLPPLTESDYHKERKKLKWTVTHRKKAQAIRDYTSEILSQIDISYNEKILEKILRDNPADSRQEIPSEYVNDQDTVAAIDGEVWTFGEFVEMAKMTSERQRNSVRDIHGLKRFIEGLAVREKLIQKAMQKGFHRDESIAAKVKKHSDLYLIHKMNQEITDTVRVSDERIFEYYEQFKPQFVFPKMINVREILVNSEKLALELLDRARQGEDFSELARKHSIRKWSAKRGGELGYGTKSQYGIHAEKLFQMKGGEIGGPFKTDSYYSIIQVIGFREARQKSYDQAKSEIEKTLLEEKKRDVLLRSIQRMRDSLHVEYDMQGLT